MLKLLHGITVLLGTTSLGATTFMSIRNKSGALIFTLLTLGHAGSSLKARQILQVSRSMYFWAGAAGNLKKVWSIQTKNYFRKANLPNLGFCRLFCFSGVFEQE